MRDQIRERHDTFSAVRISEGLPYWHFLCLRSEVPERRPRADASTDSVEAGFATPAESSVERQLG
jgi:hypothetical protein